MVPAQSGTWEFETSNNGDGDPYLQLHDGGPWFMDENDDGGYGYNALITAKLDGGELYIVTVDFLNDESDICDLTAARK